jgi:hypothetical protein
LVEKFDHFRLSIVRIRPLERLVGLIPIDQGQIGIDPVFQIGTMGVAFGRREDHMFQTEIARIDIEPAVPLTVSKLAFEAIGRLLDLRKENSRDETFKGDEVAKERPSHFLPVIVGKMERESLTHKIDLTKERTK